MNATESLARGTPATEGPLPANLAAALAAGLVAPAAGNGHAATPEEQAELVAAFKSAMAGNPPDHPTLAVLQENPRTLIPAGAFDAPPAPISSPRAADAGLIAPADDAPVSPGQGQVLFAAAPLAFAGPSTAPAVTPFPILQGPAASRLAPATRSDLAPASLPDATDRLLPGAATAAAQDQAPSAAFAPHPTLTPAHAFAPAAPETAGTPLEEKTLAPDSDRRGFSPSDPAPTEPDTLGAAVLQSMLAQGLAAAGASRAPAAAADTTAVPPAARLEKLQQVVAETVSRVLVSDPLHDGNREVRVEFARDVLPDTSVRLWRDAGRLHVEFSSTAAVADLGLRAGLPGLAAAIQRQDLMVEAPVVSLRLDSQAGQPGDGRSRQQYYPTLDENGELA